MSHYLRLKVFAVTTFSLLTLWGSAGLAHAAPQLQTIEHFGVVQMPTEHSWPGRGSVVVGRIKLLTDSNTKSDVSSVSFSLLVVTQKYIAPFDALGELRLQSKKNRIFTLDVSKQESWLKVSEAANTATYVLKIDAGKLRLPLNQLVDIDIAFTENPRSKLTGKGMGMLSLGFGIFDKTIEVIDTDGNHYLNNKEDKKLDAWGVSTYFSLSLWSQSKEDRKRIMKQEQDEAKYVGKTIYLKERTVVESGGDGVAGETSGFQEKHARGYIKSKTRSGMYDVEFISGSDGKLPINLVSFSKVK